MFIAYKTGVECIDKRGRYFIFHNKISETYGFEKDVGQDIVQPPFCDWLTLPTLLRYVEDLRQADWENAISECDSFTRAVND